jgi:hypothetical protein
VSVDRLVGRIFWTGVALGMIAGWLVAMVPQWLS